VVYGHHWGDNAETDFTSLDPTPYLGDINVLSTFHHYDPFAFTGQGLSWLLDGRFRPDLALRRRQRAGRTGERSGLSSKTPNLTPGQSALFENELAADIANYATSGTPAYLAGQLAKVQSWARAHHIGPWEILVGEYGVAQPSHNTLGDPLPTSSAWVSSVLTTAHGMGFAAAVWDLDNGFGITCGEPAPAYEDIFP
jgi:endoglucanase